MMAGRFDERLSGTLLLASITLVDALSCSWFGYNQGVFAGVLISQDFIRCFPETVEANISGITTGCFAIGAAIGALTVSYLGGRLGQRRCIMIGMALSLVGTVLQTFAWHLPQMVIGRIISGAGIGITGSMSPVYLAECAPARMRGKLVSVGTSCNVLSFCLSSWINYGLYYHEGAIQWRFPIAFQLVYPMLALPVLLVVPESPRWLLFKDREHEARRVLARLAGRGTADDHPAVMAEFKSIQSAIRFEKREAVSVADVLRCRDKTQNLRRVLLSIGAHVMQQVSGINSLGFYFPTILLMIGFDEEMSRLLAAINGTVYSMCLFSALLVIDRVGRRRLTMIGLAGMGACHLVEAVCFKIGMEDASRLRTMAIVVISTFMLYHLIIGTTFGATPWVYSSEINSIAWRARGSAAGTFASWIMCFTTIQITRVGIDNLGWRFFLMFCIICWVCLPIVYLFYPETSRRTLEDMDHMFFSHPGLIVCNIPEMTMVTRPPAFILAEQERIAAASDYSSVMDGDRNYGEEDVQQVVDEKV